MRVGATACFGAASTTATGPALLGPCGPRAATWKWKVRAEEVVFCGSVNEIETLPDAQLRVSGSELSGFVELNVQVLARCTIAKRWTAPPAAGSFAGVAVKRSMLGVRTCRVTFGFVARATGPTEGGRWAAAAWATKAGLAARAGWPGVEPAERVSASPTSAPALATASARRTAR